MKTRLLYTLIAFLLSTNIYAQWEGTWNTSFGEVRLIQIGDKVYGDYKDVGSIEGTVNGSILTGTYTNLKTSGSKKGKIQWTYTNNAFIGKWGDLNKAPTNDWTGTKRNGIKPTLISDIGSKVNETTEEVNWTGTWDTSSGEVRLVQIGDKVYGDYKNVGVIEGKISGTLLRGHFTNNNKKGTLLWALRGDSSFEGKWGREYNSPTINWTGNRKSTNKPKLSSSIINKIVPNANSWQGIWDSDYGELRFAQKDNKVYGDYKNVGYIEGTVVKGILRGIYTNGNDKGYIEFKRDKGLFTGKWGANQKGMSSSWNGTIKSTRKPRINYKNKEKIESYEGRYRITVTRLLDYTKDLKVKTKNREVFGTIGIRLKGKGSSGDVVLKALNNKEPRVWDVSKNNPATVKPNKPIEGKDEILNDLFYSKSWYIWRSLEIDRSREFIIKGDLANKNLIVNIQAKLGETDFVKHLHFPWTQRNLYVNDMVLGEEYYLESKSGDQYILVCFKLEKIN